MEDIKELVRENLVTFRKERKMTQLELANKIGYSDKTISRWETGEVTPDIETLNNLADLYDIPISMFFEKYDKTVYKKKKFSELFIGKKIAIATLTVAVLWYLGIMWYIYLASYRDSNQWIVFIWLMPITFVILLWFNRKWFNNRICAAVFMSGLCWTALTAVYLQFIDKNMYMLFVSGAPMEVAIILWTYIKPNKNKDK